MVWGVSENSERARSVVDLWMTGNEIEQSFVRRWSTELFSPVFGCSCLLPSSLCSGGDLVRDSVPSSNCQK